MTRLIGNAGEGTARKYLESIGMEFVDKNVRRGRGEIDLIMREGIYLVFCEVKLTRSHEGTAGARIDGIKIRRLKSAAQAYLATEGLSEQFVRFDAVLISGFGVDGQITHIKAII